VRDRTGQLTLIDKKMRALTSTIARRRTSVRRVSTAVDVSHDQPWKVDATRAVYADLAVQSILDNGFVMLPALLSQSALAQLHETQLSAADSVADMLADKGVRLDVGSVHGFHEVCLRSPGRFDFPHRGTGDAMPASVSDTVESIATRVLAPAGGAPITRAFAGVIRAEPGCNAQLWHADSPHKGREHAPPHLLNVLIALRDIERRADRLPAALAPADQPPAR
jgi:hypothetical protein